jgi:uncharacterized sulfatase
MDLFHTLTATLSNAKPNGIADGIDLKALLQNPVAKLNRDALYFHYPHYYPTTTPVSAIRAGDWKLLEYLEDGHLELYNLQDDLSEKADLASTMPEKAESLRRLLHEWRSQVGAAMPTANPKFKK